MPFVQNRFTKERQRICVLIYMILLPRSHILFLIEIIRFEGLEYCTGMIYGCFVKQGFKPESNIIGEDDGEGDVLIHAA